jgi:hypothetical protein
MDKRIMRWALTLTRVTAKYNEKYMGSSEREIFQVVKELLAEMEAVLDIGVTSFETQQNFDLYSDEALS